MNSFLKLFRTNQITKLQKTESFVFTIYYKIKTIKGTSQTIQIIKYNV